MRTQGQDLGLKLLDDFVSEGQLQFTSNEAVERLARSPTATANLLRRLLRAGLIERVRRGHYAIHQLGTLGTAAAAEDVLRAVAAGFADTAHRVAYRSALDHFELLSHPSRSIQVALTKPTRAERLSGRPLTTIVESEESLSIGADRRDGACVSDLERALLDASARPELIGGIAILAEALAAAASKVNVDRLMDYARRLHWGAALRRIGSLADALELQGVAAKLAPLTKPTSDIELEPGGHATTWRDSKWWVRWDQDPKQLLNVHQ